MGNHNTGAYRFEITGNSIPVIEAVETVVEPKTSDVIKEQQINSTENYKSNQQEDGIKDKNQSENKETDNSLTGIERLAAFMSNIINIFGGKNPIFGVIVSIVLWIVGSRS